MPRTPLQYMDLDVWLVASPDGRGLRAYTLVEPHFCLVGDDAGRLARECAGHLGLYAMTDGYAARFVVEASLRPGAIPAPGTEQFRPPEPGCVPVGRLVVTDVLDGSGRSMLPRLPLPTGGAHA